MHQYIQNYSPLRLHRVAHEMLDLRAISHLRAINHVRLHGSVIAQPEAVRDALLPKPFLLHFEQDTRGAAMSSSSHCRPWLKPAADIAARARNARHDWLEVPYAYASLGVAPNAVDDAARVDLRAAQPRSATIRKVTLLITDKDLREEIQNSAWVICMSEVPSHAAISSSGGRVTTAARWSGSPANIGRASRASGPMRSGGSSKANVLEFYTTTTYFRRVETVISLDLVEALIRGDVPSGQFPYPAYVETRGASCSRVSLVDPPPFSRFEFDQRQTEIFFCQKMYV